MQRYLLVFLQLHQSCGGQVSAQSRVPAHTLPWDLATSELPRLPGQERGPRAGFSVGSLWDFPERCPQEQVAGGRAHPVPRMSPEVTSSYLCGCSVSPLALAIVPNIYCAVGGSKRQAADKAPTTSGRIKNNRKRICVGGPKRYQVGQKIPFQASP